MSTTTVNADQLTKVIQSTIFELIECGGTTPDATCEWIAGEHPDLYKTFGHDRVRDLCEVIQYAEVPEASARLRERFRIFNQTYFSVSLPEYEVRVVNDIRLPGEQAASEPTSGHVDFGSGIIFIAHTRDDFMSDALLHHMAHVATGTNEDTEELWIAEMERLKTLAAPLL